MARLVYRFTNGNLCTGHMRLVVGFDDRGRVTVSGGSSLTLELSPDEARELSAKLAERLPQLAEHMACDPSRRAGRRGH